MSEEREKIRCLNCYLTQWRDRVACRRCGKPLPEPIVQIVERVVEKFVIHTDPQCLLNLEQTHKLIPGAAESLPASRAGQATLTVFSQTAAGDAFPTMAEVEKAMIMAAYERANRKPVAAARLLGIGKTTLYRKLRDIQESAA